MAELTTEKNIRQNQWRSWRGQNANSDDPTVVFNDLTVEDSLVVGGSLLKSTPVISGSGATVTLTAAQSGSVFLYDRAAGIVVTLPTPAAGLTYTFVTTVSVTSNAYKVITATPASQFLLGTLVNVDVDSSNAVAAWSGDGTSHVAITSNGTTTGGLIGSRFSLTAVSTTLWVVEGITNANGTVATPFATS
jgi:hypothetical protein